MRGRLIGSAIGLATCLVAVALAVWTSGTASVSVAGRLFGLPDSPGTQALAYAVVVAVAVAIYGYRWLVRSTALLAILGGLLLLLMPIAFGGAVRWDYAGGEYLLGDFWPTWVSVAATVGVAGAVAATGIAAAGTPRPRSPGPRAPSSAC